MSKRRSGCFTWQGKRKLRMSYHDAHRAACRLGVERGEPFNAYACPECGWWHVGHAPRRRAHPMGRYNEALFVELGSRALGCLNHEVSGTEWAIAQRVKAADRRRRQAAA